MSYPSNFLLKVSSFNEKNIGRRHSLNSQTTLKICVFIHYIYILELLITTLSNNYHTRYPAYILIILLSYLPTTIWYVLIHKGHFNFPQRKKGNFNFIYCSNVFRLISFLVSWFLVSISFILEEVKSSQTGKSIFQIFRDYFSIYVFFLFIFI